MGINPFDEPNVAEAKEKTKELLDGYAATGRLPETEPLAQDEQIAVHTRAIRGMLTGRRRPGGNRGGASRGTTSRSSRTCPRVRETEAAVAGIRRAIRAKTRAATTFGVGPRYLHSTGQYHKGGPNTRAGRF